MHQSPTPLVEGWVARMKGKQKPCFSIKGTLAEFWVMGWGLPEISIIVHDYRVGEESVAHQETILG